MKRQTEAPVIRLHKNDDLVVASSDRAPETPVENDAVRCRELIDAAPIFWWDRGNCRGRR